MNNAIRTGVGIAMMAIEHRETWDDRDRAVIISALYILFKKREEMVRRYSRNNNQGSCYYEGLEEVADFAIFAEQWLEDVSAYDIYSALLSAIKDWEDALCEEYEEEEDDEENYE